MLFTVIAWLAWQPDPSMLRQLYEEALQRKRQEYGASDARSLQAARDLGLFLSKQEDAAGAQKVFSEVVRLDDAALGANAGQTLADVAALANVSPPRLAEPLWRRASASPDPKLAARAFAALGQIRETAGDQAGAAGFYRQALTKEEAALDQATTNEDKARLAILIGGLVQVMSEIVDPAEGITMLQKSLAIDRTVLGARHPETATVEASLAAALLDANRMDESVRVIGDAIPILEEALGEDHPRVAISAAILAAGLRAKGDYNRAEENYRRAVAIDERAYGSNHQQTLNDIRSLAQFLRGRGKTQEAAALEKRLASGAK
jgi:tetratricopeptide (TPR) repeat protein